VAMVRAIVTNLGILRPAEHRLIVLDREPDVLETTLLHATVDAEPVVDPVARANLSRFLATLQVIFSASRGTQRLTPDNAR
jgi:hypothetical protein